MSGDKSQLAALHAGVGGELVGAVEVNWMRAAALIRCLAGAEASVEEALQRLEVMEVRNA